MTTRTEQDGLPQASESLADRLSKRFCWRRGPAVAGLALGVAVSVLAAGAERVYAQPVQPVQPASAPNAPVPLQPVSVPPQSMPGPGAPGSPGGALPPAPPTDGAMASFEPPYTYNPSGRRDPFAAIVLEGPKAENMNLPPLQRTSLTELTLIGIVWGGFGYTAMVQTADGKGYAVRQGTKIGPNNGVVSVITENSVVVQERFIDVYGKKQVREYVKLLHQKENTE
jgi:type IV pilus assembly protein PilP